MKENKQEIIKAGDPPHSYIGLVDENGDLVELWWTTPTNKTVIFFELMARGYDKPDLDILWKNGKAIKLA